MKLEKSMLLTLTPNRRLANSLESLHAEQQIKSAKMAWLAPTIKPFMLWVNELFSEINVISPNPRTVLSKVQQQLIVEQIILESQYQLLNVPNTAAEIVNALEIMELWCKPISILYKYSSTYADTARFIEWVELLKERLHQKNFFTEAGMILTVIENLHLINKLPNEIIFYAFDEVNPLQQYFINQLQKYDVLCKFEGGENFSPLIFKQSCLDSEDEYLKASHWALQELKKFPEIQIGIIIPNLTQDRKLIVDLFSSVIPIESLNISAPISIKKYTMIELVFLIFKICDSKFKYSDLISLIKNPYISCDQSKIEENAQLLFMLQDRLEYYTNLTTVIQNGDLNFSLIKKFSLLHEYLPKINARKSARDWIEDINAILSIFDWPRIGNLSITEQHLLSCFANILEQYLFLDHLKPRHTFNQALEYIHDLCDNVPFLPVDSGKVQVHVLGLLEGVGLQFDKIWVANMSREQWPQEPKPNPFIPQVLQQQFNMPHSCAHRELEISINLTNRLLVSANKELIFSYAILQDGVHVSSSFLIKDFKDFDFNMSVKEEDFQDDVLEVLHDENAVNMLGNMALNPQIIKYQAECSFKAFAYHGLQLQSKDLPQMFLSASERGRILHQALARFWYLHKTHEKLLLLNEKGNLYSEVESICSKVMKLWQIKKPFTISDEYLLIEQERLVKLVYSWLCSEMSRESFTVVAVEQRYSLSINGVTVNCQIDRIDSNSSGAKIIIDYKTGQVVLDHMISMPLLAPQLPIYALTQNTNDLVAVTYAIIKPSDLKFIGVGIEKNYLPNLQAANLSEVIYLWNEQLNSLVDKFVNQSVTVNPINQQACLYCNLHSLCRIYDAAR